MYGIKYVCTARIMSCIGIEETVKCINGYKKTEEFKEIRRSVINMEIYLSEPETQTQLQVQMRRKKRDGGKSLLGR